MKLDFHCFNFNLQEWTEDNERGKIKCIIDFKFQKTQPDFATKNHFFKDNNNCLSFFSTIYIT